MRIDEIESRKAEIRTLLNTEGAEIDVDALTNEVNGLNAEAEEIRSAAAKEAELRSAVAPAVIAEIKENIAAESGKKEERTMEKFDRNTVEYRDAFYAMLKGNATAEQRGIFADNTASGDGYSLPVGLDNQIWDQLTTAHPILNDIDRIAFGTAIKVTQATPVTPSKRKDSDTVTEMTFTFTDITLAGNDYLAPVFLSYAEAKMSDGAMEKFLASAIVGQIGEAIAKDVFARIISDATANKVTKASGTTYFEAIGSALGLATQADAPVIYAPSALYYAILKEVDSNGQPIVREGVVLGAELKKDNAATCITVVDPKCFVLDEIAPISIKAQEMVAKGGYDYAGYARAEGCLRKVNAAAYIG